MSSIDSNPLSVLGFNSTTQYYNSNLFRLIRSEVLARDERKCRFRICALQKKESATQIIFLHRTLSTYLGIGCSNLFSVCVDCYTRSLTFNYPSLFFAVSGKRVERGNSRKDVGAWYRQRFDENQKTAQKIFESLSLKNQEFVKRLILAKELGNSFFYWEYLGLPPEECYSKESGDSSNDKIRRPVGSAAQYRHCGNSG